MRRMRHWPSPQSTFVRSGRQIYSQQSRCRHHHHHLLSTFYVPNIILFHVTLSHWFLPTIISFRTFSSPSWWWRKLVVEEVNNVRTISWLIDARVYCWSPGLLLCRWKAKYWVTVGGGSNPRGGSIYDKFWRMSSIFKGGEMEVRGKKGILKRLNSKKIAKMALHQLGITLGYWL